ncbi:MAG: sugar ABC transporter ATP-binding protein [Treponema sp.]
MADSKKVLLQALHICKSFPSVKALDDINFDLYAGEVHALLGENGAGKSTLMKIFSGVYTKDSGDIIINGEKIDISSPRQAQQLGIGIVHQELNLCPHLTIAENIFLGREYAVKGILHKQRQKGECKKLLQKMAIDLDPDTLVGDLPVSKQQMVEICKILSTDANIIIMDEPTSALSETEIDELFLLMHELKQQGKGIIYISHRLEELARITDRVTILRDGTFIGTYPFKDMTLDSIISKMVGRQLSEKFPKVTMEAGEAVFEVEHVCAGSQVRDISFTLRSGEIVGIAGLVGAGRTETLRALFGADTIESGVIKIDGEPVSIKKPRDAIKRGLFLVPEDRKQDGLCVNLAVDHNLTIPNLDLVSKTGVIHRHLHRQKAQEMTERLGIKTPSLAQYARNLSGGNQQKIVVGKWLMHEARVVMFDEPTRGIDVAAKIQIYTIMNTLKQKGIGVLFVSSELPEVLGLADRILVMCNGKITADLPAADATQESVLHYATAF